MGCNYMGNLGGNEALFENWIPQLQAMVKEERNHPSIFAWSIENELTLINARNFGLLKQVEPRITRAAKAVMAMDPTRPAMIDGGNCLSTQTLPVNGAHYIESSITGSGIPLRDYPDQAYTWEKIVENEKTGVPAGAGPADSHGRVLLHERLHPRANWPNSAARAVLPAWGPTRSAAAACSPR